MWRERDDRWSGLGSGTDRPGWREPNTSETIVRPFSYRLHRRGRASAAGRVAAPEPNDGPDGRASAARRPGSAPPSRSGGARTALARPAPGASADRRDLREAEPLAKSEPRIEIADELFATQSRSCRRTDRSIPVRRRS